MFRVITWRFTRLKRLLVPLLCLALYGGRQGLRAQSALPTYTPSSQNNGYFFCYDPSTGIGNGGCDILIYTGYYPQTNAHFHEAPNDPGRAHPQSTLSSPYATHGGNAYNHYMTSGTYSGLQSASQEYISAHNNCAICVNDAALPMGGKFDVKVLTIYQRDGLYHAWESPHSEHDRGTAVDIGANTTICPNYAVNIAAMLQACSDQGAVFVLNEGDHAHCNWQNKNTYPH